jgi:hypothetical protein
MKPKNNPPALLNMDAISLHSQTVVTNKDLRNHRNISGYEGW